MTTLAHLRALYDTIGSALDDIERTYKRHNVDFPSPDTPVDFKDGETSIASSPSEALLKTEEMVRASNHLVAACGQLLTAVQNPFFTLMEAISAVRIPTSSILVFLMDSAAVPYYFRSSNPRAESCS